MKTFQELKEQLLTETSFGSVLDKHGYKPSASDANRFAHKSGHEVELNGGGWSHKGANKKLVATKGDSPESLNRHLNTVASRQRAAANKKGRDAALSGLGLKKVRGAQGGIYWESEGMELDRHKSVKEATQPMTAPAHPAVIAKPRCANCGEGHATADHAKSVKPAKHPAPPAPKGTYLTRGVYEGDVTEEAIPDMVKVAKAHGYAHKKTLKAIPSGSKGTRVYAHPDGHELRISPHRGMWMHARPNGDTHEDDSARRLSSFLTRLHGKPNLNRGMYEGEATISESMQDSHDFIASQHGPGALAPHQALLKHGFAFKTANSKDGRTTAKYKHPKTKEEWTITHGRFGTVIHGGGREVPLKRLDNDLAAHHRSYSLPIPK